MTDLPVLLLTLGFVLVCALLLVLNLRTPYPSWLKASVILFVSLFYMGSWYSYQRMTGWASSSSLPAEFRLVWITIDETHKKSGEPGYIYYWIRHLDEAGFPEGAPRAHRIPWHEAAAEAAEQALSTLESGDQLNGRLSRRLLDTREQGIEAESIDADAEESSAGIGGGRVNVEFVTVPPRSLPAKPLAQSDY